MSELEILVFSLSRCQRTGSSIRARLHWRRKSRTAKMRSTNDLNEILYEFLKKHITLWFVLIYKLNGYFLLQFVAVVAVKITGRASSPLKRFIRHISNRLLKVSAYSKRKFARSAAPAFAQVTVVLTIKQQAPPESSGGAFLLGGFQKTSKRQIAWSDFEDFLL